ncbi:MAG: putative porin, partial [Planctomycetes bacterium]|nr:putative porin [Planctomycetota bacterium]
MMRMIAVGLAGCLVACMGAAAVRAADDDVQKQIQDLHRIVMQQQQEISSLRSKIEGQDNATALQADRERLAVMVREELQKATADAWYNKWSLKGDFRYRHEWINDGTLNDRRRPRIRHRIRARVGAFTQINDEWDVGLQLATGSEVAATTEGDPSSTNQTLDNYFSSKHVWWDLAYARYRPKKIEGLQVLFGKMVFPFYKVGGNEMMWDNDVRPEGIAFNYELKAAENLTVYFNGGGFWLDERNFDAVSNDTADTSLWVGQLYAKADMPQIAKGVYLKSGITYYDYANVEGFPVEPAHGLAGNTRDIARGLNRYAMDYNVWNPFVEFGWPVAIGKTAVPLAIFADFAINAEAEDPVRMPLAVQRQMGTPTWYPENNDFA